MFYKGTVEDFKTMLDNLYQQSIISPGSAEAIKYNDIKKSVVYISDKINEAPTTLDNFEGAVYAHGAIIAGSQLKWKEDVSPEPTNA